MVLGAMVLGALHLASVVVVGGLIGSVVGARPGAAVGAALSVPPALVHAVAVVRCRPYPPTVRGAATAVVDLTWAALSTWAGALFLAVSRARGNRLDPDASAGTTCVHLVDQAVPGYATTVGMVIAGCSPRLLTHERVHVLQARLLGPLYLPLVGVGFVVAALVPYWLLSRSARRRVHGLRSYLVGGVYPNTWHEWWAYRVARAAVVQT